MNEDRTDAGRRAGLGARAGEVLERLLADVLAPGLYVVATPIGNLGDVSLRALAVLARAHTILAEDTRHSKKLLSHFGVSGASLVAFHEHNAERQRPRVLARLEAGAAVALISDAGTPLVCDPGYKLMLACREAGIAVTSVPGPSALLAALTSAGLPCDRFFFEGFLPAKQAGRRKRLEAIAAIPATLIFYEAPQRIAAALADMAAALGPREAAVARELTKLHEEIVGGTLGELAAQFGERDVKGEIVVLIGPPETEAASDADIRAALAIALASQSLRDASRDVAAALGVHKTRVYKLGLALQGKSR